MPKEQGHPQEALLETKLPVPAWGLRAAQWHAAGISPPEVLEMLCTASFPCKHSGPL